VCVCMSCDTVYLCVRSEVLTTVAAEEQCLRDGTSVSQPPGRGPVPGPGINYTGPREVLLEFVILVF